VTTGAGNREDVRRSEAETREEEGGEEVRREAIRLIGWLLWPVAAFVFPVGAIVAAAVDPPRFTAIDCFAASLPIYLAAFIIRIKVG
jgi:hypothetical protein